MKTEPAEAPAAREIHSSDVDLAAVPPRWVRWAAPLVRCLPAGRFRLMNWLCRQPVPPFWGQTGAERGGFQFVCDLRDSIAREVCFMQRYEAQETALMQRLLRPGMTFADVGANWGYFTLLAATRVGPTGRVVSLEPEPRLFAMLQANVARNGFDHVLPRQVAAADRVDMLHLAAFDEQTEKWGISHLVTQANQRTIAVPTVPVDGLLDELGVGNVDLLKLDIEGAEELALRGMASGLSRHRYRMILLEVHPTLLAERGQTVANVLSLLTNCGYRLRRIDHSPAATRRAAYARQPDPEDFLLPEESGHYSDDAWPHLLCLSPGFGDGL
jgi:FkbM family methyltransferase